MPLTMAGVCARKGVDQGQIDDSIEGDMHRTGCIRSPTSPIPSMTREIDSNSRALRISLQAAFFVTTLMSLGAIFSATSVLSGLAVVHAFALSLFPISNFMFVLWILANPRARRILAGDVLVNTPTFANRPLFRNPGPDDLPLSVTVQVPVYTESFAIIRETIEHALAAVNAYNKVSRPGANIVVSDDALMIWADNDLPGFLAGARTKRIEHRSEVESKVIERIDYYHRRNIPFVARPKPIVGVESTQRNGRFKKAGNLNRTIQLAESIAKIQETEGLGYEDAAQRITGDEQFSSTYVEGEIRVGDVILMLDKDSITPPDALVLTIPEFVRDGRLAYTQHKTFASNESENYFTGIMGVFTRLVFSLVFPAKALQGWMPPFMGHNGFVRKSVLAESGYWSEDRVGEDLDFTMWATASGRRGKYIAYEGVSFGEQVTRTYAEEAGKYNRYGFSILEIMLKPVSSWLTAGFFTNRFKNYIRSDALSWEHKTDLMVVYPFFYINLALIPLMTVFIPFVGVNVMIYGLIFFLSLAPPLLLANQQQGPIRIGLAKRLGQFQALGFLFIAFGLSILKGFVSFFSGNRKIRFAVTSVDNISDGRTMAGIMREMSLQLILAGIMLSLVSLSFSVAYFIGDLSWVHLAVSSPVLISVAIIPFLMSPALLEAFSRKLSDFRVRESQAG